LTLADEVALTSSIRIKYEASKKSMALAPSDKGNFDCQIRKLSTMPEPVLEKLNRFQRRAPNATIHVYWFSDDGGE